MTALRHVLCPIDFSDASVRCVAHAAALARWRNAPLTLLHVESPVTQRLPEVPPAETTEGVVATAFDAEAHASDVERIRRRAEALFEHAGVPFGAADLLVDLGRAAPHILDRARSLPADVIVLGTHGHGGVERFVLGSVAERVLRQAPCDVLVVPSGTGGRAALPYRSIVCGVDFSPVSERALRVAGDLARESGARLTAVHVIGWPWDEIGGSDFGDVAPAQAAALAAYKQGLEVEARTRLDRLLAPMGKTAAPSEAVVLHGRAYREILQVARDRQGDVIVLGVVGRNPFDRALFGSTASQIVRAATCPVWVTRLPGS